MSDFELYDNPLITRYASREMAQLWGPQRKHSTWRRLWLALAEGELELNLLADDGKTPRIRPDHVAELRQHLDDIDFGKAAQYESKLRHDVMAHIHTLGDVAPLSKEIVHLGATSCFVTDNTDLLLLREGLQRIRDQLVGVIDQLAKFAQKWKSLPALGYTHFQPAQLTTVGKRACLWCADFVTDLGEIEHRLWTLKFRGVKGTTGTQASFLELFRGDHDKVKALDQLVAKKMGFEEVEPVTGQTYSRKVDRLVLDALAGIAESAHKCATDWRLLCHEQELDEPFGADQVGSSAMAYKRNPMRSERICSIARFLMGLPAMAAQTTATQWLERTLDDSAARRLYIPQAFLAADAICRLLNNVTGGLIVNDHVVARNVNKSLPFIATENLLMAAVAQGGDRQQLHEHIRQHSHAAIADMKAGSETNSLIERLKADPAFANLDIGRELNPQKFVGRAPEQVDEFLEKVIEPLWKRYAVSGRNGEDLKV